MNSSHRHFHKTLNLDRIMATDERELDVYMEPTFVKTVTKLWTLSPAVSDDGTKQSISYFTCLLQCVAVSIVLSVLYCVLFGVRVDGFSSSAAGANWWSNLSSTIVILIAISSWWIVMPIPFLISLEFRCAPSSSNLSNSSVVKWICEVFHPKSMPHALILYMASVWIALPLLLRVWPVTKDSAWVLIALSMFVQNVVACCISLPFAFALAEPKKYISSANELDAIEMQSFEQSDANREPSAYSASRSCDSMMVSITPHRLRGIPESPLYLYTLMFSVLYWSPYIVELLYVGDGARVVTDWIAVPILLIGILIMECLTRNMSLSPYVHIGWITYFCFLYLRYPHALQSIIMRIYVVFQTPETSQLFRVVISAAFHMFGTAMLYVLRIVAIRSVVSPFPAAFVFGWQFFESFVLDLAFLDMDISNWYFYFLAFLLIIKNVIRDLDMVAEMALWIERRYFRERSDKSLKALTDRMRRWREVYPLYIMRHQTFISECCSKSAIITIIMFEILLVGDQTENSSYVTIAFPDFAAAHRLQLLGGMTFLFSAMVVAHLITLFILWRRHQIVFLPRNNASIALLSTSDKIAPVDHNNYAQSYERIKRQQLNTWISSYWSDCKWIYLSCLLAVLQMAMNIVHNATHWYLPVRNDD